jgi:hypothetical protein
MVDAVRYGCPYTYTNEQNMECDQAMILGKVTIVDIATRLGINVAHPWCKPLV